jgi:hypothetical protein
MIFDEDKPAGFPSDDTIKMMADYFYGRGIPFDEDINSLTSEFIAISATSAGKKVREAIQLYELTLQTGIKGKLNYADHGPDAMVVGDYPEYNIKDGTLIELKEEQPNEGAEGSFLNFNHKFELSKERANDFKERGLILAGFGRNGLGVYMTAINMIPAGEESLSKDFDKMVEASKHKKRKDRKMTTAPSYINTGNLIKSVLYQDGPEYFRKKSASKNHKSPFYYALKFEQTKHDIDTFASNLPDKAEKEAFDLIINEARFSISSKTCKKIR